jgi:putative PIN family toxin of toxin-antitoxin system
MIKAVFDTTVLISAFLRPKGVSDELLDLAASARFSLILSVSILAETARKLLTSEKIRRSYSYPDDAVHRYLQKLSNLAELVAELPPLRGVVRDPNDDVIVATAVAAGAEYLVARDKDLLDLRSYEDITIITPEAFRGLLRQQEAT